MILSIDTTKPHKIILNNKKITTHFDESKKLLPAIDKLLKRDPKKLTAIIVAEGPGTFSSLRIGVVTANALGFALNIPVNNNKIATPKYGKPPNITKSKPQKHSNLRRGIRGT